MSVFDFGPHTPFILASYAIGVLVLAALTGWLIWDGERQTAQLAALESRRAPADR